MLSFHAQKYSLTDADNELRNSTDEISQKDTHQFFIAYEFGEAVFNKFQSLSGELGWRFNNQHMIRLVHINHDLTEEHLSSGFAGAVDGDYVEGKLFGFETFYDFPIFTKGLYISPSIGYYRNEYRHTMLQEDLQKSSCTLGTALSYRETNIFNVKGLYYMFSIPMRISLDPIKETKLGDTIIKNNTFENNIWLFIGYAF